MKPERNSAASTEGVEATGGEPQMVGDGMAGSPDDVNQRTTVGGDERASRDQSIRSSAEAGHGRGAKGRRKVVLGPSAKLTDQGSDSAARPCVRFDERGVETECKTDYSGNGNRKGWQRLRLV